jgi:hypothetical protein
MANKNDSIAVWRAKVKQDASWNDTLTRIELGTAHENSLDLVTSYETHLSVVPYWIETLAGEWEFGVARLFIGHTNPEDPYDSLEEPRKTIESSDGVGTALTFTNGQALVVSVPPFATQNFNGFSGSADAMTFAAGANPVDFEATGGTIDTDYYSKWVTLDKRVEIPEWAYAFRVHLSRVSFGGTDTTGTARGITIAQYMDNEQWTAADGALTDLTWISPWLIRDGNRGSGIELDVLHDATASIDVTFDVFVEFLLGISPRVGS